MTGRMYWDERSTKDTKNTKKGEYPQMDADGRFEG